jgi:hypothetical protein
VKVKGAQILMDGTDLTVTVRTVTVSIPVGVPLWKWQARVFAQALIYAADHIGQHSADDEKRSEEVHDVHPTRRSTQKMIGR